MGKLERMMTANTGQVRESIGVGRKELPVEPVVSTVTRHDGTARNRNALDIPVSRITRDPGQPREEFEPDALARLAQSIRTRGLIQPVRVRWDEDQKIYVLICGERRWRAAQLAGLETISAVVTDETLTDTETLALQLIENALREDLKPVEQGKAFNALMRSNAWSIRQLSIELGISRQVVDRAVSLLELPENMQRAVDSGDVAPYAAYEITLAPQAEQAGLISAVLDEGLGVTEIRQRRRGVSTRRMLSHRDANGCRISVTIPEGLEDDEALAAVGRALRAWRGTAASKVA